METRKRSPDFGGVGLSICTFHELMKKSLERNRVNLAQIITWESSRAEEITDESEVKADYDGRSGDMEIVFPSLDIKKKAANQGNKKIGEITKRQDVSKHGISYLLQYQGWLGSELPGIQLGQEVGIIPLSVGMDMALEIFKNEYHQRERQPFHQDFFYPF